MWIICLVREAVEGRPRGGRRTSAGPRGLARLMPMPMLGRRAPAELRERTTVAVLGMHRSGPSAVAGMLADHGVEFGPVSQRNRFNPRGNREIQELNRLHDRVLERSGGSW